MAPHVLLPHMSRKGPFSVETPGAAPVKGEGLPRRNPAAKDGLITQPNSEVRTIFDILSYSAEKFGNAKALGSRRIVKTHNETKMVKKMVDGKQQEVEKKWTFFELSGYTYRSFVEYQRLALQLGAGLRDFGLQKGNRLHLFAATHPYWLALSHAAASQSMPIATAYDTLGVEGLRHSLNQTKSNAIYCDPHLFPTLKKCQTPELKLVIYNEEHEASDETLRSLGDGVTVLSVEQLRARGESHMVDPVPPEPEDLCCIMYTSGSTGPPKGVPIKHKAVIAAIAGVNTIVGDLIGPGDGLLAYLPAAHILEFVFESATLFWGGTLGYGSPRTISDSSVRNCKGDIREFQPTILVGVPQVWETVRKGIVSKVESGSALVRNLFWGALSAKNFMLGAGLPGSGLLDAVVFNKVREATGGRLRICMNGGGPIAADTQRFLSMAICPVIIGYGLTETTAMGALMDPRHWTTSAAGDLPSCIEMKLVDFLDAGYSTANNPPQGEIWIRGPSVLTEYYENSEETKEAIEDGWFKTGDIGEWDANGHIRLIDRKKNLVKTLHGEYIALEKLESIYRSAKIVANICVYAASDKSHPVAIILVVEPELQRLAAANGLKDESIDALCANPKMQDVVLQELQKAGRAGGLSGIEIISGVALADGEWTAANGMTTAAQKIQRKAILAKYQKEVDAAYKKSG